MNYLAHIFLSYRNEDWMVGNFVADYISQNEVSQFSKPIQEGIRLHRYIDMSTDQHPLVKACTRLIRPYFQKYSPVVVDIYFDYFLIKFFDRFYNQDLQEFCEHVYHVLQARIDEMPDGLQRILPKMIRKNWLMSYGSYEGIQFTFLKLKSRVKFDVNLDQAVAVLIKHETELGSYFVEFFPDIIKMTTEFAKELDQPSK